MAKTEKENATGLNALRPKLLAQTITALALIRRPVCIEGSPGLGKTAIVKQVVENLTKQTGNKWGFILKHLPTMQPEDFGLPMPNVDKTKIKFIVPDWFPTVDAVKAGLFPEYGVLLFDDRNQAEHAHQKILANIVQERELHGEILAHGWSVMSTGNRASDRSGANKVLAHLRNRETVFEFQPDLDEWCDWAYTHSIRPETISFIRFRPGLLSDFDGQRDANPTPRSWAEGVSPILDQVPQGAEYACVAGAVGEGAAVEFMAFLKFYREMPDPDEIIKHPKTAEVPTNPATLYAVCGALAQRANAANLGDIIEYTHRLSPEYSIITVMDATRRDDTLWKTAAFTKWATMPKYQSVMVRN